MKTYACGLSLLIIASFKSFGQCQNSSGSSIYTKLASYNCHQYVRAALIGGYVNMTSGIPTSEGNFSGYNNQTIAGDQNFIRVCQVGDAKAVLPVGFSADHSAIILNNGIFASTPNGSTQYIYTHQSPRAFTSACTEEYYAAIPQIAVSGASAVNQGSTVTFTLTNNGQALPSYLQLAQARWSFNSTYFTAVTSSSTSITLTATNVTGSSDVSYNLRTGCNGDNGNYRSKSVQVLPNCTGTLNGGSLNTFNMVPTGPNQIVMYLSSWTWVRTSGSASWSTSNGGKNMTFTISSGCSTFNAYNSSCNLTFTFCKSSSFAAYTVMDMKTMKVIKEGKMEDMAEINTLLIELPSGAYIINIDGSTTRYIKSN